MKTVTLDTVCLLKVLDNSPESEALFEILSWHKLEKIKLYVSNRIFDHDTSKMRAEQIEDLNRLIESYKITVEGSVFRSSFSMSDGRDLLSGGPSLRTSKEIHNFKKLVGEDPAIKYPLNATLSNKLGDYDSLKDHFCAKRDVFVTLDKKHYLATEMRPKYAQQLGLIILSPLEFIEQNAHLR